MYVVEHRLKIKNRPKLTMITFVGEFEGYCVPGAHLVIELRGTKSIREGMKMLYREIQNNIEDEVKTQDEKVPKWDKVVVYSDKLVAREALKHLKENVDLAEWDEEWEIQKKMIQLEVDKSSQIEILLNVCQTIRKIGQTKGKELYEKLIDQVKKEENENYIKFIDFFWNDELKKLKKGMSKPTALPYICKKYFDLFKKELIKKEVNLEILFNVLRYFELNFRQKLMEKNYKQREKMMRRGRNRRYYRREEVDEDNPIEIESQDFIEDDTEESDLDKRHIINKIKGIDVFVNVI
jgi:hypothetical protein